jgi:hypothetical protein
MRAQVFPADRLVHHAIQSHWIRLNKGASLVGAQDCPRTAAIAIISGTGESTPLEHVVSTLEKSNGREKKGARLTSTPSSSSKSMPAFPALPTHRSAILLVTACAIGIGIVLRAAQFVDRGDLWLDEAMLAISIVTRTARALIFSPLDYNQMAPPLFVQLAKLSTSMLGPAEYAFRLPAFVSSLASLFVFPWVLRRFVGPAEAAVATVIFAVAPTLVLYSAELKQYSGDVLAALLITGCALELRRRHYAARWALAVSVLPLGIVWFSDPAVIVLAGCGLALLLVAVKENDAQAMRAARIVAPAWAVACVATWLGARRRSGNGTAAIMERFWDDAFWPVLPRSRDDLLWLWDLMKGLFVENLGMRWYWGLPVLLGIVGIHSLVKSGRLHVVAVLFLPFAIALLASAAHMYPLAGRLALYLAPAFTAAVAVGVVRICRLITVSPVFLAVIFTLAIIKPAPFVLALSSPESRREDVQPVLAEVGRLRGKRDAIFVFAGAGPAVSLYAPRHGLDRRELIIGPVTARDMTATKSLVDSASMYGRVWIVASHDAPAQRAELLRYVEARGTRLRVVLPSGAIDRSPVAFLYDFSRTAFLLNR